MAAYRKGISLTKQDIETGGSTHVSLKMLASDTDYCMIPVLGEWASIGRVTIPSTHADRPTLVQTVTCVALINSTGPAER